MIEFGEYWQNIYKTKKANEVSWFAPHLSSSLKLIESTGIHKNEPFIDVGGGASTLVDDLLVQGFTDISVLDISAEALEVSKKRLGKDAQKVNWMVGDITKMPLPKNHFSLWHDRAVFHFLTRADDREQYKKTLWSSLKPQGFAIIAVFSLVGPTKCSGLEIVRYSAETIFAELGSQFKLLSCSEKSHETPFGTTQSFIYCLLQKM